MANKERIKVIITKLGLDGHDRGAKVVARILREAGMEVIYLGLQQTPEGIVKAALQEDVDVIGISCLTGEHLSLVPLMPRLLKENHRDDIPIIVGGVIPRQDTADLKRVGVSEVFTPGSTSQQIVSCVKQLAQEKKGSGL